MFSMDIEEPPKGTPGAIKEDQVGQANLESMIRELAGTLIGVKHEQEYMHVSFIHFHVGLILSPILLGER